MNSLNINENEINVNNDNQVLLKHALQLTAKGIFVFPLSPKTKIPLKDGGLGLTHGFKDAFDDPEKVRTVWEKHPRANIGLALEQSRLIGIDVDGDKGKETFAKLEEKYGPLPPTVTVITPGKMIAAKDAKGNKIRDEYGILFKEFTGAGIHYIYRDTLDENDEHVANFDKDFAESKVDIKGRGGCLVAVPSVHPDGTGVYKYAPGKSFDEIEVAELPEAWREAITKSSQKKVPPVTRNNTTTPVQSDIYGDIYGFNPIRNTEEGWAMAISELKRYADGREIEILENVAKIPGELLDGKHHPCPKCGGKDRFRYDTKKKFVICNQCFSKENGDFFAAIKWMRGLDFCDTFSLVEKYLLGLYKTQPDMLKWEPFPVEVLPKWLRNYAKEAAASLNIDPAFIAPFCLAAIASVLGSGFRVRVKGDWLVPPIIWMLLVAPSGAKKSQSLKFAMQPINDLQNEADKVYQTQMERYQIDDTAYQVDYQTWKGKRKGDKSLPPPEKPKEPEPKTYVINDATMEAVIERLASNPFGFGQVSDEGSGWFGGFDAYRNGKKDESFLLSFFNGTSVRLDRKGGIKRIIAATPALSVCAGIQQDMLLDTLRAKPHLWASGFLPRMLFSMPPDRPSYPTFAEISDLAKQNYREIFERIISWRTGIDPFSPNVFDLSLEAREIYRDFRCTNEDGRYSMAIGAAKAVWAKMEEYPIRIAMVLHAVRIVEEQIGLGAEISVQTMEAAIRLTNWFKHESLRIIELTCGVSAQNDLDYISILEAIQANGGTASIREIVRRRSKFNREGGSDRLKKTLREMVAKGILTVTTQKSETGGPSVEIFQKREFSIDTTQVKPEEKQGSVNVNEPNNPKIDISDSTLDVAVPNLEENSKSEGQPTKITLAPPVVTARPSNFESEFSQKNVSETDHHNKRRRMQRQNHRYNR